MNTVRGNHSPSAITEHYSKLTSLERIVADYVIDHPEDIVNCSITTLARKIGTNPPAITRFCQKLGYDGFSDFKHNYRRELSVFPIGMVTLKPDDPVETLQTKLLQLDLAAISDTINNLNPHLIRQVAKMISRASLVEIFADGGPGASASYSYQLFWQMGIRCVYFTDAQIANVAASQTQEGAVVMWISYTGESKNMYGPLVTALRTNKPVIGITASPESSMAKISNIVLQYDIHILDDIRYLHIARMCETAVIGILQSAILNELASENGLENLSSAKAIRESRLGDN